MLTGDWKIHELVPVLGFLSFNFCFFQPCFAVFVYRSCTYFVRFITNYFLLFEAVINCLLNLNFWLLLLCRNTNDFCMLILYLATLTNLLINSSGLFFGRFLWIFYIDCSGFLWIELVLSLPNVNAFYFLFLPCGIV